MGGVAGKDLIVLFFLKPGLLGLWIVARLVWLWNTGWCCPIILTAAFTNAGRLKDSHVAVTHLCLENPALL